MIKGDLPFCRVSRSSCCREEGSSTTLESTREKTKQTKQINTNKDSNKLKNSNRGHTWIDSDFRRI